MIVSGDLKSHPSLPAKERMAHLQTEVSLINENVSYKKVISTWFLEILLFLKNNQLKITFMPKRHMG